jgi:2-aminobenzoate-CoA ligase
MPAVLSPATYTGHRDLFARDNLPPVSEQPEFLFDLPELQFPERLNCATELLDKAVNERGWGERMAIRSPSGDLTYRELLVLSNRIAQVLVDDMALIPGNRVLLRGFNNPMLAACWFAVIKAGGIAVTTMPLLRAQELIDIVSKAEVSHALCDARLIEASEAARSRCSTLSCIRSFCGDGRRADALEPLLASKATEFVNVDTASDDTCIIAFTSGTTGKPKGTMHFHRDVMAICNSFPRSTLCATADDIFCGTPPLGFTFGLGGLLLFPLHIGASTVLVEKLSPETLVQTVADYCCTVMFTAPTFYRMMAPQVGRVDITCLRKCVSAGEALPVPTRERWQEATGIRIIDGIGATELLHIFISADEDHTRAGATGKPIPGYRACIMDCDGNPLPPGKIGCLAIKGPTGCRYLADPRQLDYVKKGWNLTGDSYLVDADGYFVYQARTDDMIISAGYNIGGPEVEDALLAHPAVLEAAVVGCADDQRGQVVKAFVVLRPGHARDALMAKALQEFVKQQIAPYKYPRLIVFCEQLPRTETGKLQRYKLREGT